MARLRPRGPAPRATLAAGASAVLDMPGLAVPSAVLTAPTLLSSTLAMPGLSVSATSLAATLATATLLVPGLDITARPTIATFAPIELDMPGLAVAATLNPYTYLSSTLAMPGLSVAATLNPYTYLFATLAMPGLSVSAAVTRVRDVAATLAMPGLDVPKAIVSGITPSAVLAMPGLAIPTASVVNIAPTIMTATLAMPGLSVAATVTPPAGQFRLAPDYRLDWVKLQNLVPPSVVQIGAPVVTGVRMSGKPTGPEVAGNVALVSKNKSGPGWSGAFTLKRTDAFAPLSGGGSAFLILYFGAVGDGTSPPLTGFFVDPVNGSDANAGTQAAPWLTIAKAQTGRVAGDVVYLRGGTFRTTGTLTLSASGAAGNPVTFKAYPGEAPVLNANLAAYETPVNTAWELVPGMPAGVACYRTVATLASDAYSVTLQYNNVSYALNRYASLSWLQTTTYVYSTNPTGYYRGPGFFYNAADSKLYIRLDSLTGAKAVDLDQGNSAIPPGFDFNIPNNPDPRLYRIDVARAIDVINFTGHDLVWDGIEVRGGDRSFIGVGTSLLVQNATIVGHRVGFFLSTGARDWHIFRCPRLDSGFFGPWAAWAEIKDGPREAQDQKRSLCTQSTTNDTVVFEQCRLGRYYDGFTASGHHLYIINCDAEFIEDDGMQCDTDAYDVQFCRNYWRGPILTDNGATPQTVLLGSKYVVGNIIDNQRDQVGYLPEFFCRLSHPSLAGEVTWRHSHSTVVSHSDSLNQGVNPKRYAQNTFIYSINVNNHGCGIQREQRGAGVQESYNNVVIARDKTKAIDGGDTRDQGEIRDGNVYWRQGAPTLEPMFTKLVSTSVPGGASYQTLALFKAATAVINETKTYYTPGWEAKSIEADPLLVDIPNQDFRLQGGSPAASGFVDLSGKGWPFLETGTHAGAVKPGAVDKLGNVGATFFRSAPDAVPPAAQVGPYPWSTVWNPLVLTGNATTYAVNADQWPTTTYLNGHVCAAWGDGNGFNNDQSRSSLGISEITGAPPATLTGVDKYQSGTTVDNRKPNAILHIGNIVANTILLWHVNQTQDGPSRFGTYTAISTDNGTTWAFHEAAGERVFSTGAATPLQVIGAVQLGPAYDPQSSGLDTNYVYLYLNNSGNLSAPFTGTNGSIWLCRVKIAGTGGSTANIWNPAKYSFFNGIVSGAPTWTADGGSLDTTKTVAVFPGGMGKHFLAGWSEVNNRFFAALTPTASTLAVYEAPTPWGPWGTLYYGAGSDPTWTGLFTASLPGPWQTTSKLWLAVSGAPPDSLEVQSSPLAAIPVAAYPVDIAQWDPTTEPVTTTFASHITGARLSFFFSSNALGVDPPPSVPALALFRADGSVTQVAADGSPAGLRQDRNFPFDYTLALSTASPPVLTLTQHDAGPPVTDRTITWTNALLGTLASPPQGAFIWLCTPGRIAEVTAEGFFPPGTASLVAATLAMPGLSVAAPVTNVGGGTNWLNGYANRRTFVIPPQGDLAADTLADFILTVDTAKLPGQDWSWLATEFLSVAGGFPLDLRFTTTASPEVKLDHWTVLYDAVTPRLVWKMRVPGAGLVVGPSGTTFPFRLYSGKAAMAASEENIPGVFVGTLAARVWPSGRDISGHARHLTPSGVTAGTVDGLPGGVFGSASFARLDNPTWLDGVGGSAPGAGLTEEIMLLLANATGGNLWRAGGTPLQPPPLNHNARASTFLNPSDAMQPGWNPADATGTQVNNAVAGAANSAVVGQTHLWHFVRSSGANCHLYMDETEQPSTYAGGGSPTAAGSLQTVVGDVEGYGAGTGVQTTAVIGTYGLALLWPKVLGPSWVAASARSQLTPRALLGVGAADVATDPLSGTTSPVAVPVRRTIVGQTDIDVAALAFDDQSPRSVALVPFTGTDPNCAFSTVGGMVRAIPAAGATLAPAVADYSVAKGAKRSTARLFLTVSAGVIVPGGYFKTPNLTMTGGGAKTAVLVTSAMGLQTALGLFGSTYNTATHYIKITNDFGTRTTSGSDIIINKGGTRAHPLVITMANAGLDTSASWTGRPTVYNSCLRLQQPWIWLYGIQCEMLATGLQQWRTTGQPETVLVEADNAFITACHLSATVCIHNDNGSTPTDGLTINYNWFQIAMQAPQGQSVGGGDHAINCFGASARTATNVTIAYNHCEDHPLSFLSQSFNYRFCIMGNGQQSSPTWLSTNTEVAYNFINGSYTHCMEFKVLVKSVHHNHAQSQGGHALNTRGDNCNADSPFARPQMYLNRCNSSAWEMNGRSWDYANNWIADNSGAVQGQFNLTPFGLNIEKPPKKNIGGSDGAQMIANKGDMVLGNTAFEPPNYSYENLGSRGTVLIAGHVGGSITDGQGATQTSLGNPIVFSGGHPTGSHPHLINAQVTQQSTLPPGYTAQVPPILNATITGPGASGDTWS